MTREVQTQESRPGRALEPGELARLAAVVLSASPFPALVLEVPSERIVAAGPKASQLLDPSGAPVVDHLLEDYTSDQPAPGVDLRTYVGQQIGVQGERGFIPEFQKPHVTAQQATIMR